MACLKMCFVITVQAGYSIHPQTKVGGVLCGSRSSNYGMLGKITTGYPSTPCCSPQVGPVIPFQQIYYLGKITTGYPSTPCCSPQVGPVIPIQQIYYLGKITTGYPSTPCCSPQVGPVNPFLIFLVTSIWSGTSGLKQEVLAKLFDCINMPFLTSLISMLAFRNNDSSFHQIIICHHYAYFELIHFFISSF